MTRTERLLRLARQRGDRAAELILIGDPAWCNRHRCWEDVDGVSATVHRRSRTQWTEAELRAAWGDR